MNSENELGTGKSIFTNGLVLVPILVVLVFNLLPGPKIFIFEEAYSNGSNISELLGSKKLNDSISNSI